MRSVSAMNVTRNPLPREEFRRALLCERARADRNEHQFSIVLLQGNSHGAGSDEELINRISKRIRIIDEIGWFDERRFGLLLPYTSSNQARSLVDSIRHMAMSSPLAFTIYTYPGAWLPEEPPESGSRFDGDKRAGTSHGSDVSIGCPESLFGRQIPVWKRFMDILLSAVALVILSPLFAAVAITIALVSPGPILLKQKRVGYRGKSFVIWKFRTMSVGVDTGVHENHLKTLMTADVPLTKLDRKGDPRIIPLGNLIRRCCLDELPQLINVLRGDMSLVGPRPCLAYEMSQYRPWQRMRGDAVPGMTGLWQVSGKNKTTFKEMMRLDIAYVRRLSLGLDVRILLRTFPVVLSELMAALSHRRENTNAQSRVPARPDSQ